MFYFFFNFRYNRILIYIVHFMLIIIIIIGLRNQSIFDVDRVQISNLLFEDKKLYKL